MKLTQGQIDKEITRAISSNDHTALQHLINDGCLAPEVASPARLAAIEPAMTRRDFGTIGVVNDWIRTCAKQEPALAAALAFRTLKKMSDPSLAPSFGRAEKEEFSKRMLRLGVDPYIILKGESMPLPDNETSTQALSDPTFLAGVLVFNAGMQARSILFLLSESKVLPRTAELDDIPYAGMLHVPEQPGRAINLLELCLLDTGKSLQSSVFPRIDGFMEVVRADRGQVGRTITDTLIEAAQNGTLDYGHQSSTSQVIARLIYEGAELGGRSDLGDLQVSMPKWGRSVPLLQMLCTGETPVGMYDHDTHVPQAIQRLLKANVVDIDATDSYGRTALHAACDSGLLDRVRLLIEAGARVSAKDKERKTPKDLALATKIHRVGAGTAREHEIEELDRIVSMLDAGAAKQRIDTLTSGAYKNKVSPVFP